MSIVCILLKILWEHKFKLNPTDKHGIPASHIHAADSQILVRDRAKLGGGPINSINDVHITDSGERAC